MRKLLYLNVMAGIFYSIFYTMAFVLALPYYFVVGIFRGKYLQTLGQRFGSVPVSSATTSIWVHAVSVGEFLAARPLIQRLEAEYPGIPCFVSTTTITGQNLAAKTFPKASFYFPFDWRWCIRRVFARIKPRLILVMETEIWPNFLREAERQGVPVLLINGRLSARSFSRYRLFSSWFPKFDECAMQSEESAERMRHLELSKGPIEVMGNLKFDFAPPPLSAELRRLVTEWKGDALLWIAGSSMPGEEDQLAAMLGELQKKQRVKLLLAPRHPERFGEVERILEKAGVSLMRRSENKSRESSVFLLDSIGELASVYELSDLVLIGGTMGKYGGHNPIEPAYFGKAIVTGPHYENFRSVFDEFQRRNAIVISEHPGDDLSRLAADSALRQNLGAAAAELVRANRGAVAAALAVVRRHLAGNVVQHDPQLTVR